jgi:hypothetical protein
MEQKNMALITTLLARQIRAIDEAMVGLGASAEQREAVGTLLERAYLKIEEYLAEAKTPNI